MPTGQRISVLLTGRYAQDPRLESIMAELRDLQGYTPSSFDVPVEGLTWDGTEACRAAMLDWLRTRLTPCAVGATVGPAGGDPTVLHLAVTHPSAAGRQARQEHEVVPTGWTVLVHLRALHVQPPAR